MKGHCSIAEHLQDYIEWFYLLEQWEEREELSSLVLKKRQEMADREKAASVFLPAVYLGRVYGFSDTEYLLLMYAAACEADGGLHLYYQKRYGEKQPDFQYALHLLSLVEPVAFEMLAVLCSKNSMWWELFETVNENTGSAFRRPMYIRRNVLEFLLSGSFPLPLEAGLSDEGRTVFRIGLHKPAYEMLTKFFKRKKAGVILVHGRGGCGKKTLLREVCEDLKQEVIFLRISGFLGVEGGRREEREELVRSLKPVCRMWNPVIVLDFHNAGAAEEEDWTAALQRWFPGSRVCILTDNDSVRKKLTEAADICLTLEECLSKDEKKKVLACHGLAPLAEWQEELLGRYRLSIGELERRLLELSLRTEEGESEAEHRRMWGEVFKADRGECTLGRLIESRDTLEDFVGGQECKRQLQTVIGLARNWHKHETGQPFVLLFHGESGTGKTMAASVLAAALQQSLFKVDLSGVFDKYIGETEKHVDEIFRAAGRGNYILFFDEAESLFAKRTGISDSSDRYANVSTAYLLQRIEAFDGIVILATNLPDHFDSAFLRRIRYVIKFRALEEKERALLWEKALQGKPETDKSFSGTELAQMVQFCPARIKAAAMTARMLAVNEGSGSITGKHILEAVELEASKDETAVKPVRSL